MTQPDSQFVGALFLVTELMVDNIPVSIMWSKEMVSAPTQDQVLYTPVQATSLYSLCDHPFFTIKVLVTGNNQLYFYIFTDSHMLKKDPQNNV